MVEGTADRAGALAEALRLAANCVEQANLPVEYRPVAFSKVFDAIVGDLPLPLAPQEASISARAQTTSVSLDTLARRLGIRADQAEYVYDLTGADLGLVLARSKLPAQKARATKMLALIYAAGRQAIYDEEWTPVSAVREQCRLYGTLDSANFASTIADAGDALLTRGRGSNRHVKVTRTGYEEAGRLVAELARP